MSQDPKGQDMQSPDQKTPPMEGSVEDKKTATKSAKADEKMHEATEDLFIGTALAYPKGHKAVPAKSVKRYGWEDNVK